MVAQGGKDTAVDPSNAQVRLETHDGSETLWMVDMVHVFDVFFDGAQK